MRKLDELMHLFRIAGAPNPTEWAQSEVNEGIPQLARYLFLRQAWKGIIADGDVAWIQREIDHSQKRPGTPGTGLGLALERLTASGATTKDLSEVARTVQWQLLHSLCYLLSDPSIEEPDLKRVGWALFEIDDEDRPGRPIGALHESVLETDPTGREMRPKQGV